LWRVRIVDSENICQTLTNFAKLGSKRGLLPSFSVFIGYFIRNYEHF